MINIFIEVSLGSKLKYEYCHKTNKLVLDRILHNTNTFPYNYGFLPNTLSPDGDPLDAIVICNHSLQPGSMVNCKILGGIETIDEKGLDDKIILIPSDKIDPYSKDINNLEDLDSKILDNIKYFLNHYKDNEEGKYIIVKDSYNKAEALKRIKKYTLND
jgi:inorganic pyrophosphatase